jgi:hypothetical protein
MRKIFSTLLLTLACFPTSCLAAGLDLSSARDITGIELLPPVEPGPRWLFWGGWVLIGTGLAFAGLALLCRRLGREEPLEPHQWARQELERIEALELLAAGKVEQYHTLLADVVRRYLEKRHGVPAPTQTTAEFLAGLERSPVLPETRRAAVRDFLERCDLAKFARVGFSEADCRTAADLARQLTTEPQRDGKSLPQTEPASLVG